METDGRFVIVDSDDDEVWNSERTAEGSFLIMQDDGNLVRKL